MAYNTHVHKDHLVHDSLEKYKPEGCKFYKYTFKVECVTCHRRYIVYCKNLADAEANMAKYELLPSFPH